MNSSTLANELINVFGNASTGTAVIGGGMNIRIFALRPTYFF